MDCSCVERLLHELAPILDLSSSAHGHQDAGLTRVGLLCCSRRSCSPGGDLRPIWNHGARRRMPATCARSDWIENVAAPTLLHLERRGRGPGEKAAVQEAVRRRRGEPDPGRRGSRERRRGSLAAGFGELGVHGVLLYKAERREAEVR